MEKQKMTPREYLTVRGWACTTRRVGTKQIVDTLLSEEPATEEPLYEDRWRKDGVSEFNTEQAVAVQLGIDESDARRAWVQMYCRAYDGVSDPVTKVAPMADMMLSAYSERFFVEIIEEPPDSDDNM